MWNFLHQFCKRSFIIFEEYPSVFRQNIFAEYFSVFSQTPSSKIFHLTVWKWKAVVWGIFKILLKMVYVESLSRFSWWQRGGGLKNFREIERSKIGGVVQKQLILSSQGEKEWKNWHVTKRLRKKFTFTMIWFVSFKRNIKNVLNCNLNLTWFFPVIPKTFSWNFV